MNEKCYITTAIAYASGKPHIGNTYDIVLADAYARYKRLLGYDVYFQTGTDEHGEKIQRKALDSGILPQEYVDNISGEVKRVWDSLNTSYNKFVRTSDPNHKDKVTKIFKKLFDQGDLYKGTYNGLYCTPCESFFTESQLIEGKCPDCGREVKESSEQAYFFNLKKYTQKLCDYLDTHPDFIQPESRKNEIINNFIKPGLQDLCVTRTSFNWGVPVDFDLEHVIYVWIDALSNYITFLGYDPDGNHSDEFKKYWPADIQFIGKDIIRFHSIYWPILLMALDLPLPKTIFAHPWVLFGEDKMSKSKGNIVYADELAEEFGVDTVRYYLLHEIPFSSDGTFTYDLFIDRINSDLANILGNLVNRTISMSNKYFDGIIYNPKMNDEIDNELKNIVLNAPSKVKEKMDEFKTMDALDCIFEIFRRCNKYIDETTPWILAKDESKQDRLKTVLYNLLESIRSGAVLLQSFLPETAKKIFHQLNTDQKSLDSINFSGLIEGNKLNTPEPLFIRIDKDEKIKELIGKN